MKATEDFIESRLGKYLDRRTPPRQIAGNEALEADEIDSILRTILRFNPGGNLEEWWQRVEDGLATSCETYSWPLPKHFAKAAEAASKAVRRGSDAPDQWVPDPVRINANRMNRGEPVGEFWLYGDKAIALEDSGMVPSDVINRYRSAAYFRRVTRRRDGTEDRTQADAWESAQRCLHDSIRRDTGVASGLTAPDGTPKKFGPMTETPSGPRTARSEFMTPDEIAAEDAI